MKKNFVLGIFIFCVVWFLVWFIPRAFLSVGNSDLPSPRFVIGANWDAARVARALEDLGEIDSAFGYRLYALFDQTANHPRAGTYSFLIGQSYRSLARQFALGPADDEVTIRIIEGWNLRDIAHLLESYGVSVSTTLAEVGDQISGRSSAVSWLEKFPFLARRADIPTLEGYLFPDTYRVWKKQLPQGLIEKQLSAFGKLAPRVMQEAEKQHRNLHDVVILASIVEKEVARSEDRKIVAGIFMNRLRAGMPLQSDATLEYVTGSGRARASSRDLQLDSPFNTYRYRGLPPEPISNPGADAIEAALFPAKTDNYYFLTDAAGKTYFAKTLEEHVRNRKKAFGE